MMAQPLSENRYLDGKSTAVHAVTLCWNEDTLSIVGADGTILDVWPLKEIRRIPAPGGDNLLRLSNGHQKNARLLVSAPDEVDRIVQNCPDLNRSPEWRKDWWRSHTVLTVGAIVSILFIVIVIVPSFAEWMAKNVPSKVEQSLGEATEKQVIKALAQLENTTAAAVICASPYGKGALAELTAHFTPLVDGPFPLEVKVLNISIPNAITLPGGRILIFRGLLEQMSHPNAAAGVLAHEIAHVQKQHSIATLARKSAYAILFGLLVGDVTGGTIIALAGETALNNTYSRTMEREADEYALSLMQEAGLSVAPIAGLFRRLQDLKKKGHQMPEWLSTHPGLSARIDMIESAPQNGEKALSDRQWRRLKHICG